MKSGMLLDRFSFDTLQLPRLESGLWKQQPMPISVAFPSFDSRDQR